MSKFEEYHYAWLSVHQSRTEEWLSERLKDGFDIHHLDGDHSNNDPSNLVLIECQDHISLHGGKGIRRVNPIKKKSPYSIKNPEHNKLIYDSYIDSGVYSVTAALFGITVSKVKLMVARHQLQQLQQLVDTKEDPKPSKTYFPHSFSLKI